MSHQFEPTPRTPPLPVSPRITIPTQPYSSTSSTSASSSHDPNREVPRQSPHPVSPPLTPGELRKPRVLGSFSSMGEGSDIDLDDRTFFPDMGRTETTLLHNNDDEPSSSTSGKGYLQQQRYNGRHDEDSVGRSLDTGNGLMAQSTSGSSFESALSEAGPYTPGSSVGNGINAFGMSEELEEESSYSRDHLHQFNTPKMDYHLRSPVLGGEKVRSSPAPSPLEIKRPLYPDLGLPSKPSLQPRVLSGGSATSSSSHHSQPSSVGFSHSVYPSLNVYPQNSKASSSTNPFSSTPYSPPTAADYHAAMDAKLEARNAFGDSNAMEKAHYGHHSHPSIPTIAPQAVPFTDSTIYWLGMYFFFNLGLTLFNKMVLVSFPFPWTLTGLHALSGCAGCYYALERGSFIPARLNSRENLIMGAFSVLYTINIAVSNLSLNLVSIPFHQVVRASTPLFTIFISTIFLRSRFSAMKLVSLLPVVAGVGFATYGDYYFTAWGLILTLLGTFLAALKTVVTNVIQTGGGGRLKLHPLDLLMRMSPLAFIQCVIFGWWSGELDRVRAYGATQMTSGKAFALLINGAIAFGLNIVSFTANKKAGALTMTVSANCKQVLTIAIAVVLFDVPIAFMNGIGILLTLIGGGWYAYVEYSEKNANKVGRMVNR